MVNATVNTAMIIIDTLIELSLLVVVLGVWTLEDYSSLFKFLTSGLVFVLAIVRWYYFFKNKNRNEDSSKKT